MYNIINTIVWVGKWIMDLLFWESQQRELWENMAKQREGGGELDNETPRVGKERRGLGHILGGGDGTFT